MLSRASATVRGAAGKRLAWEKHTASERARYVLQRMGVASELAVEP